MLLELFPSKLVLPPHPEQETRRWSSVAPYSACQSPGSMLFCPTDGSLLMVESGPQGWTRFCCQTCPYIHPMEPSDKITRKIVLKKKAVDDIMGGEDAWANVDKTQTTCPFCNNKEAFFLMVQLRSADEPMTCFYKCTNCKQRWKE